MAVHTTTGEARHQAPPLDRRARDCEQIVRARGITPHIRQKGDPPLVGRVHERAQRWVVDRTGSCCNRLRAMLVPWEGKASNYLALHRLACALITLQHS